LNFSPLLHPIDAQVFGGFDGMIALIAACESAEFDFSFKKSAQ
jgi:hypothetical protein